MSKRVKYREDKDSAGERFGKLIVLEIYYVDGDKKRHARCKCLCDCGIEKSGIALRLLRSKDIASCGCNARGENCKIGKLKFRDLTGQIFERITVLEKSQRKNKCGHYYWKCQCICGTVKEIDGASLRRGSTVICGCYHQEIYDNNRSVLHSSPENIRQRKYIEYYKWKDDCNNRDSKTCQICKCKNNIRVHHKFNYADFPDQRTNIDNGVCLCKNCHVSFHKRYGERYNTPEQYEEFKIDWLRNNNVQKSERVDLI